MGCGDLLGEEDGEGVSLPPDVPGDVVGFDVVGDTVGLDVFGDLEGDLVGLDVFGDLDGDLVGLELIGDEVGRLVTLPGCPGEVVGAVDGQQTSKWMAKKKNLQCNRFTMLNGVLFTSKGSFLGSRTSLFEILSMLIQARTSRTVHPLLSVYVRITSPDLATLREPVPTKVAVDVSHVGLSAPLQISNEIVLGMP
jgi:hypothetical protein